MTQARGIGMIPTIQLKHRLQIARELTGMNQTQFAKELGVGVATVARAESGAVKPKRATVMAWALATGVDLQWLENGKVPHPDGPDGGLHSQLPRLDSNQQPFD